MWLYRLCHYYQWFWILISFGPNSYLSSKWKLGLYPQVALMSRFTLLIECFQLNYPPSLIVSIEQLDFRLIRFGSWFYRGNSIRRDELLCHSRELVYLLIGCRLCMAGMGRFFIGWQVEQVRLLALLDLSIRSLATFIVHFLRLYNQFGCHYLYLHARIYC